VDDRRVLASIAADALLAACRATDAGSVAEALRETDKCLDAADRALGLATEQARITDYERQVIAKELADTCRRLERAERVAGVVEGPPHKASTCGKERGLSGGSYRGP
jgi:hypothetical protein